MSKTKERAKRSGSPLGDKREDQPVPVGNDSRYVNAKASGEKVGGGGILGQVLEDAGTGYDYDKIRCAQHLCRENIENLTRLFLEKFLEFHYQALTEVKASTELTTKEKVAAITNLADAFNKMIKASSKAAPGLHAAAVASDTIRALANFVVENHDIEAAKILVDVLEPFGRELAKKKW